MRKKIGGCLLAVTVMVLVVGCGAKEERTTIHVKKDGKIEQNVTESFDQDNYDEKELKTFIKQEVEDYIEETGNEGIKASGISVSEGIAYMTMKFDDTKVYSDFNQETLYTGTVVQAVADGYTFEESFYAVKEGKVSKTATDKDVAGDDSYKVVITSESTDVAVTGEVVFVSRNDVKIKEEKRVSIQKENEDDTSLTYIIYK